MLKNKKWHLAFIMMLLILLPLRQDAYAGSVTYGEGSRFTYTDDSGIVWEGDLYNWSSYDAPVIVISGCDRVDGTGTMTIPGVIDGHEVIATKDGAFSGNEAVKSGLKKLVIPDQLSSIGSEAFLGCGSLEEISFGNGLKTISSKAFGDCSSIRSLSFNEALQTIEVNAFRNCDALTEVRIPSGLSSLQSNAFSECDSLAAFTVSGENGNYSVSDGVLFNKDGSVLLVYPKGKSGDSYVIPGSVTSIGECAFMGSKLTSVEIPAGTERIGIAAFLGMSRLSEVTFKGNSLEYIGQDAFSDCDALTRFDVPDGVAEIGEAAFAGCGSLATVSLPASLEKLGDRAFIRSHGLKTVTIPADAELSALPYRAFESCTALEYFRIPDKVKSIGSYAFSDCASLRSVYVPDSVEVIGDGSGNDGVFYQCGLFLRNDAFTIYAPAGSYALTEYAVIDASLNYAEATPSEYEQIVAAYGNSSTGGNEGGNTGGNEGGNEGGNTGGNEGGNEGGNTGGTEGGVQPASPAAQTINVKAATFKKTTNSKAFSLGAKASTALTYKSSNAGVAAVSKNGTVTVKKPGTAVITITAAASGDWLSATRTVKVSVALAAPSLKVKNVKSRSAKITWTKSKAADGYKIYIKGPKDKKFRCRLTKSARVKSVTHKGLKKGKKYQYKVRAYKKVNGKKVYSPYSKTVSVKISR